MEDDTRLLRRRLLVVGGTGALSGIAGCTGAGDSADGRSDRSTVSDANGNESDEGEAAGASNDDQSGSEESSNDGESESAASPRDDESVAYPIVDNGADDEGRNVTIDLEVVDRGGEPLDSAAIELADRGGTPDDRWGETGSEGRIRFVESVGPPPCNELTVTVPKYGVEHSLGCHNGGKQIEETITVAISEDVAYPVVDNGVDDEGKTVYIDLAVINDDGEPLDGAEIKLADRGGTPDDRCGKTGSEGRIRFVESVGPPPCNQLTVIVAEYDVEYSLGCHNGGKHLEKTVTVER